MLRETILGVVRGAFLYLPKVPRMAAKGSAQAEAMAMGLVNSCGLSQELPCPRA